MRIFTFKGETIEMVATIIARVKKVFVILLAKVGNVRLGNSMNVMHGYLCRLVYIVVVTPTFRILPMNIGSSM